MTLEEAKEILLKDMICEDLVGLCGYECKKCAYGHDATDIILGEAYQIVTKHYKELSRKRGDEQWLRTTDGRQAVTSE